MPEPEVASTTNPLLGVQVSARSVNLASLPPPAKTSSSSLGAAGYASGTVVDVKRRRSTGELLVFIRWANAERRFAEWVSADDVDVSSLPEACDGSVGAPVERLPCDASIPDDSRSRMKNTTEFLEERLRRDMASPNSVVDLFFCGHRMRPWYYSPVGFLYPWLSPEKVPGTVPDAHLCPFTLTPFESAARLHRHLVSHARSGSPLSVPGTEVYCDPAAGISLFEVDGRVHTAFCRNVFLVSKCFLENKLVGHDADLYTFYVAALHADVHCPGYLGPVDEGGRNERGGRPVAKVFGGYYSYERGNAEYNLACIVALPCFQRRGLGRFLIAASYAIGYRLGIVGGPERPLSELGRAAYDRYWAERVWSWALDNAVEAVAQRRPVQPASYDQPFGDSDAASTTGGVNSSGDNGALAVLRVTIHDMSKKLKLESSDVLETVLRLGLVHRTESRTLKLLIPVEVARREVERVSKSPVAFRPELLRATGGSP